MKEFLTDSVLPLAGVCAAIASLTLALFDVPRAPPSQVSPAGSESSLAARDPMNESLSRVLQALNASRGPSAAPRPETCCTGSASPPPVARPSVAVPNGSTGAFAAGAGPGAVGTPPPTPELLDAVTALAEAVKAVRSARTEEDIVHAEAQVRAARQLMEATCGAAGGPVCDSAREVRSLGF